MTSPTPEQAAAIDSRSPRRVIIAHPGTGKTFTIVEILADYLGRRGRAGECITAVSFTRSAAAELKARAEARIGWRDTRDVLFGTSSALALAIIRECHRGAGPAESGHDLRRAGPGRRDAGHHPVAEALGALAPEGP